MPPDRIVEPVEATGQISSDLMVLKNVSTSAALEAVLVPEPLEDPFGRVPLFARRRAVDPLCGSTLKNAIDDAGEGIELGASDRAAAPIARRHLKPQHLGNRLAVKPKYPRHLADAHPLDMAGVANAAIHIH